MTKETRMTNAESESAPHRVPHSSFGLRHSLVITHSSLVIRPSAHLRKRQFPRLREQRAKALVLRLLEPRVAFEEDESRAAREAHELIVGQHVTDFQWRQAALRRA